MSNAQKIRMVLAYKRISEAQLSRLIGSSPSAFNQRMKTDKFSPDELEAIAAALGATYVSAFEFPDGTKV